MRREAPHLCAADADARSGVGRGQQCCHRRRDRPSLRLAIGSLAAVLAASLTACAPASAPAAVPPPGFFGVGGWSYPTNSQASTLGAAGLRLVRAALGWGVVQTRPDPASRNWADADRLARDAARDGFNIVFDLNGCAVWACGTVNAPPTGAELTAYEGFVQAAVARYGPASSFWAGLPRVPTVSWQVWNEVNGGFFWPNPTPADYAVFLAQIRSAILAVDPSANVLMSGLVQFPSSSDGEPLDQFLQGLYQQPGFTADSSAVVVHGYAPDPGSSLGILDEAKRIMIEHRDPRPMWVTEMSWAAGGPALPGMVSPDAQSAYLVQSWDTMLACRARWNLAHVLWFSLQDVSHTIFGVPDAYNFYYGLLNADGSPKQAFSKFSALRRFRAAARWRGRSVRPAGRDRARRHRSRRAHPGHAVGDQ